MRITGPSGQPTIPQQSNLYIAQHGDTLSSVAAKLGVSESDLASTNNLSPGAQLKLGQQLNVPETLQKLPIQQGIASMRDSFENAKATPGTDLYSKGMIIDYMPGPDVESPGDARGIIIDWMPSGPEVQSEGDARGIIVQSEGVNASLDAAKLAEDIRFRSQFQSPQAAMGKLKSPFDKAVVENFLKDGGSAALNTKKTESEG